VAEIFSLALKRQQTVDCNLAYALEISQLGLDWSGLYWAFLGSSLPRKVERKPIERSQFAALERGKTVE
jgi:hypothetical protein